MKVTEPGVYAMTSSEYHADPIPGGSLSSSGAKLLLPPSCPAKYRYNLLNGPARSAAFDYGHAAHRAVLGAGTDIEVIPHTSYRTKEAQELKRQAYAEGRAPILEHEWAQVEEMAEKIKAHPIAAALLNPERGTPEQCMFWRDDEFGVWRRSMLDWVTPLPSGRVGVVDYKTAESAERDKFSKSAADYGYHCQCAWYLDALRALEISDDPWFLFVVQEKRPPYLVNVIELDADAVRIGNYLNRKALRTFAECQQTGVWPGYSTDVETVSLPVYYESKIQAEMEMSAL